MKISYYKLSKKGKSLILKNYEIFFMNPPLIGKSWFERNISRHYAYKYDPLPPPRPHSFSDDSALQVPYLFFCETTQIVRPFCLF